MSQQANDRRDPPPAAVSARLCDRVEFAMQKTVLAGALAASTLLAGAATAADVFASHGPARAGAFYWQGPYVGANFGYQWGSVSRDPTEPSGVAGGVQGGYNWQFGQFVFGAETDLQASDANDVFAPWKFSNPWFGTLRGRGGVALNSVMFYGTVGLAYGALSAQSTLTGVSESKTSLGFAGGLGLEVALPGPWTARAEYLYVDLGNRSYSLTGSSHGIDSSLLRLGVNYRF
jgi:outer membrane immunogenic protein